MSKRPDTFEEAVDMAVEIVGYPWADTPDGGRAKYEEVMDVAYDLLGVDPLPRKEKA